MSACLFRPDPRRALGLDQRAREALAESLTSIFDACTGVLHWPESDRADLIQALGTHAVSPALFAAYAELVEALLAEDFTRAQHRMDLLLRRSLRAPAANPIVTLDIDLDSDLSRLYARIIDDDPGTIVAITGVDRPELSRGRALHADTTALLRAAAPDLAEEIRILAHETVLVRDGAPPRSDTAGFEGASTFYLWGAIVINATKQHTRPRLAQTMAHEAGHAYLLGSTLGAPLVENDPADRYASPLRADLRPMDGIVHASFVLARMIYCLDRLIDSTLLVPTEHAEATRARSANHAQFVQSVDVIASQARFTDDGARLWGAARAWVEAGCPAGELNGDRRCREEDLHIR